MVPPTSYVVFLTALVLEVDQHYTLVYRSFVSYDTVFSIFLLNYTTQTERFAAKLCNFEIRNYVQFSLEIRKKVMSLYT